MMMNVFRNHLRLAAKTGGMTIRNAMKTATAWEGSTSGRCINFLGMWITAIHQLEAAARRNSNKAYLAITFSSDR